MKKNVVVKGPLLVAAGYGTHVRQIARWLLNVEKLGTINLFFEPTPWGICPWYVNPNMEDGLIGEILQRSRKAEKYDLAIMCQLPNEWNPFLAEKNIGVTAGVETDICNPEWIAAINRMDMVIVPSEFTKQTFLNTANQQNIPLTTTINVVAESFLDECQEAVRGVSVLNDKLELETNFNFLMVSQFTGNNPENDRKNISYTIKWFMEEFEGNKDVGLIIKTNFGRMTTIDRQNSTKILSQLVYNTRKGAFPKVYLLHGNMSPKEMVGLYTHPKVKALVNLARAEGFCLPALEAAACGLPVITTNWSAQTEFLNKGKFIKVDYNLQPIHPTRVDGRIFVENSKWAMPIEADAKRKLKKFHESPSIPEGWANELKERIRKEYSQTAIEESYKEVIEL